MKPSNPRYLFAALLLLLFVAIRPAGAQALQEFEEKVTEFTLDNGLTFIVVNRPVAPVVSFVTFVDVGAANEPVGHTGIAHIFEHMAFKGTPEIGTTNWEEEQKVLEELDETYQQWLSESYSATPDSGRMEELMAEVDSLQEFEGSEYAKVRISINDTPVTYLIDPETGYPRITRYQQFNPQAGEQATIETRYSDWTVVDGVAYAYSAVTYVNGNQATTEEYSSHTVH